ncbi:MAG: conjugal transfer protein TraW [Alphaproteobacteria bacterium]|nr:MAG: conjugal transfer protein TraW [Alphaproteobacteria bacterium]
MSATKRILASNIRLIILSSLILTAFTSAAKDFGVKGHTHQIIEQPFLQMIDERLQKVDMDKEQSKMISIAKDRVENPKPVEGVKPAKTGRVFHFDPTYILDEDAVLPCGKILHRAGTMVNPLAHMDLNRRLFFIDSREKMQIAWLKAQLNNPLSDQKEIVEDRVILVGGSVLRLKEELGDEHINKVYFDQNGELTSKFGIKASPAIVVQDGLMLKIEEIKLYKNRR